jgi:phosphate transport system substrate-binding protein
MKTPKISRLTGFFIICGILLLSGCGGAPKSTDTDTPTTGKFKIGIDDSYSLLIDAELYTFQSLYQYTKVDTMSRSEADIFNALMKYSVSLIVVSRKLTIDEE